MNMSRFRSFSPLVALSVIFTIFENVELIAHSVFSFSWIYDFFVFFHM